MTLQQQVNIKMGTGVAGDFASQNPRHTLLSGRAQFRAGASGVVIARFAEADPDTGLVTNVISGTKPVGFVSRSGNISVITQWLGQASMTIPAGKEITLHDKGDFYIQIATPTTVGQNVFASNADGSIAVSSADTLADHYATGFKVAIGAVANDLATITK